MKSVNKVFQNKIVLYILFGLSLLNLLGYLAKNNLSAIIIFLLSGYFTTFFTKNMSYILLLPLLITNILFAVFSIQKIPLKEGMDDKENSDPKDKNKKNKNEQHDDDDDDDDDDDENDYDEVKGKQDKSGHTGKKNNENKTISQPENFYDNDSDDDSDDNIVDAKIKKQENMETAYNNLEKMMGGKNFKNMSGNIREIAGDQEHLLKVIEKMEPLMEKAGGMLEKLENSKLGSMLPKIMGSMKN